MRAAEATEILTALRRFATSLGGAEHELNAINVFPVADGDTGTNLRRTIEAMVAELEDADADADLSASAAIAALNAARGNSGLICAQFLAGLFSVDPAALFVDGAVMARSFAIAASRCRAAVAEPVEGTMISVADVAARAAADWADEADPSSLRLLSDIHGVVEQAVEDTRQQLPVLTKAGVIDAGAAGLLLWFEALAEVASGQPGPEWRDVEPVAGEPSPTAPSQGDGSTLVGFELQFTTDGDEPVADGLRRLLVSHGDSVVVSQAAGVIRAHVHLRDVGPAIEAVLEVVRPRNIEIEPLVEVQPT